MAICKGCGARIEWLTMEESGKAMPVDANPAKVVVDVGPGKGYRLVNAWTPHWATCPKAKEFKKP
jgi:hypothetical protein